MTQRQRNRRNRQRRRGGSGSDKVHQEARRLFHLSVQPYLQQINRAKRQAKRETNQTINRTQNVYGALGSQLQALADPYQQQVSGIQSDLTGNLNALMPSLQGQIGQAPATERAAAAGLVGSIGAGAQSLLGQSAATEAGYNTSAQRQGIEESAITQRNALGDLANFRQDLSQQKVDILRQAPAQIRQTRLRPPTAEPEQPARPCSTRHLTGSVRDGSTAVRHPTGIRPDDERRDGGPAE